MKRTYRRACEKRLASLGIAKGTPYHRAGMFLLAELVRESGQELSEEFLTLYRIQPAELEQFKSRSEELVQHIQSDPSFLVTQGNLIMCLKALTCAAGSFQWNPLKEQFDAPPVGVDSVLNSVEGSSAQPPTSSAKPES